MISYDNKLALIGCTNKICRVRIPTKIITYIFPPRTRLNNLSEDPPPAMPVADAAENEENDPDDSALSPGVPTLVEPCPEEL